MGPLYIVWKTENETGISIIDEQHRAIVSTINSLFYFIQEKRGMDALKPTINMLAQYTRLHFSTEEALLKQAGYANYDEHILLHKELISETAAAMRRATLEKEPEFFLNFLKNWWLNHINAEDKKYVGALKHHLKQD